MGRRREDERIDEPGCFVHIHNNESNKLPGHEERIKALCKKVAREQKRKVKKKYKND